MWADARKLKGDTSGACTGGSKRVLWFAFQKPIGTPANSLTRDLILDHGLSDNRKPLWMLYIEFVSTDPEEVLCPDLVHNEPPRQIDRTQPDPVGVEDFPVPHFGTHEIEKFPAVLLHPHGAFLIHEEF